MGASPKKKKAAEKKSVHEKFKERDIFEGAEVKPWLKLQKAI